MPSISKVNTPKLTVDHFDSKQENYNRLISEFVQSAAELSRLAAKLTRVAKFESPPEISPNRLSSLVNSLEDIKDSTEDANSTIEAIRCSS